MLMHADGKNGSHKSGGSEIWVFDPVKQKRVERFKLETWGISIEVTQGKTPLLAVVNADYDLDVYDAGSGKHIRTIGGRAMESPYLLHAAR